VCEEEWSKTRVCVKKKHTHTKKRPLIVCLWGYGECVPYKQMRTPISQHAFCLLFYSGLSHSHRHKLQRRRQWKAEIFERQKTETGKKPEKEIEWGWRARIATQERGGEGESGWQGFSFLIVHSFVDSLWVAHMSHDYRRH